MKKTVSNKKTAVKKTNKKSGVASKGNEELHKIPLRITDTTLRDAHQSLWATRMRTEDILGIIDVIDNVGYYSLEVWGGATFDVCLRFLKENPWDRLRQIKAVAKKTPLQMLLRGQNLVGYRNYSDDVVDKFVELAHSNGIDIFRIFDALNDTRNLEAAIKAVKKHGGHAQGTLSYTISPVHTIEKFVQHAKDQKSLGIDSIVIKDMAGILSPISAEKLVSALVCEVGIPVQLHCHSTSGMAIATYVEGVRAGAGAIDCAISSMSGSSSQPPVETLAAIFGETDYSPNLDIDALGKIATYFKDLTPKRQKKSMKMAYIDPNVLIHQIPGGMISNFRSQLDAQGMLDRLGDALEEVSRVREDLGYPPLVTPTSQIVGTQAAMNIITGERYKVVPNEVKDYVRGMYGRSPAPIKKSFMKSIIGDEKPIDYRPADKIEPMLPLITKDIDHDLIDSEEDLISYCILPEPSREYFKWRRIPLNERPPTPADLEMVEESASVAKVSTQVTKKNVAKVGDLHPNQMMHTEDYKGLGHIIRQAAGIEITELNIKKGDFNLQLRGTGVVSSKSAIPDDISEVHAGETAEIVDSTIQDNVTVDDSKPTEQMDDVGDYAHTVKSPLGGVFYSSGGPNQPKFVKIGDSVKVGEKICVVEAMKLFNEIEATVDCKIVAILLNDGDIVKKDQPLIAYEPA